MHPLAPQLTVESWLNASDDFSLTALRGRVVLVEVFQMLCPGCVSHALPQAQRAARHFNEADFAIVGLHSVFEHHQAQGNSAALRAFAHEYRLTFPIAIDAPGGHDGIPQTMRRYGLRGTPSTLLIDREGRLRLQHFGVIEDMALGAAIMAAIVEPRSLVLHGVAQAPAAGCDTHGCGIGQSGT